MGIDFLDVTFRLEKKLGVKLTWKALDVYITSRKPPDVTVDELEQAVCAQFDASPAARGKNWTDREIECSGCCFLLEAVPVPGFCRRCGTPVSRAQYVAHWVKVTLIDSLGVSEHKVTPDALLIKDLGMS